MKSLADALLIFLAAGVVANPARGQTTLRYKFNKDEQLNYVMEQKMTQKTSIGGNDIAMDVTRTIDMSWHIQAVDRDGKARMTQKIDRFRFVMASPDGKMEFDSTDGKIAKGQLGEAAGPVLKRLVGLEKSMSMDQQGEYSDFKVPESPFTKVFDGRPPDPDAALQAMIADDALKQFAQGSLHFPKEAVSKGDSWNTKTEIKHPLGKLKVSTLFTYEGAVSRSGKKLEQIKLKPETSVEPDKLFNLKIKSQECKGTAHFDNIAGRLVDVTTSENTEMEMSFANQTSTRKLELTVTLKLVDKK